MMIVMILLSTLAAGLLLGGYFLFAAVFDPRMQLPGSSADGSDPLMAPTGRALQIFNEPYKAGFRALPLEQVQITSFDGLTLTGYLLPGSREEVVLCHHGYRSCPEGDFCAIGEIYRRRGCTVLFVDARAHGRSQGRYIGFGEKDRFDVARWCAFLAERFPESRIFLHGVSMGAAAVLHTCDMPLPPQVRGIIADCGFVSIRSVCRHLCRQVFGFPYFPLGYVAELWALLLAKTGFTASDSIRCLSRTELAVGIVCGGQDRYIPPEVPRQMFDACRGHRQLLMVPDAGHAAAYMVDPAGYTRLVNGILDSCK